MLTIKTHRTLISLSTLCLMILGSGCFQYEEGIENYRQGKYERAAQLLEGFANQQASQEPKIDLALDGNTRMEDALSKATIRLFNGWEAYAGSLFGMNKLTEGCEATRLALRLVTVRNLNQPTARPVIYDPREGNFWPTSTETLRSWWVIMPCDQFLQVDAAKE